MRILFLGLVSMLILGITTEEMTVQQADVRLPVQRPEHNLSDLDSSKDLLITLQELHESLIKQIALLENMDRTTDMTHLVLHYTAQKDNVEREIALIKSIESNPSDTAPRLIPKNTLTEERLFQNIFRRNRNPSSSQQSTDKNPHPISYTPYYISSQDHPELIYSFSPIPGYQYPNDLISNTFPGYPPQYNQNPQIFAYRDQPPQDYYQVPPVPHPNFQIPQQYAPLPQVTLQARPPKPEPQRLSNMKEPQRRPRPQESKDKLQPVVARPNKTEKQPERQTTLKPSAGGTRPTKQSVIVYYPDGIVTEDDGERERPTIVNRFGQVLDRFGQVISNLANRQPLRPMIGSNASVPEKIEKMENMPTQSKLRISYDYPKSSTDDEMNVTATKRENKRTKLRWVSV